jgi:hypothetical protein
LTPNDETWRLGPDTAEILAIARHKLIFEDSPEITDDKKTDEEHGDDIQA